MKQIILASSSPRRRNLLKMIGLPFKAVESKYEEVMDLSLNPHELAKKLSLGKAREVAKNYPNAIIIAADTFIVCDGEYLSKVHNNKEAKIMLKKLSGKAHKVITGFTIIDTQTNKILTKSQETKVYFKKLTDHEIDAYIASGEPIEKAGAYAIQGLGSIFVEKIEGDYFNVVGLPIFTLIETLKEFGVNILLSQ